MGGITKLPINLRKNIGENLLKWKWQKQLQQWLPCWLWSGTRKKKKKKVEKGVPNCALVYSICLVVIIDLELEWSIFYDFWIYFNLKREAIFQFALTNDYWHNPCFQSTKHYVFIDKGIYAYFLGKSKNQSLCYI